MSLTIPGNVYKASVFGLTATCRLDGNDAGATLYYPRNSRLGRRLLTNADQIRAVLANYIRQEFGWPRGETHTPIYFVGV